MGDASVFILDFVIVLGSAAVLGIICERLRIGSVVGYLLAGVIVGPSVLGLVDTNLAIENISEIGVALLLFTIGLEFSWKQLVRFGGRAIIGGSIATVSILLIGTAIGVSLGLASNVALVLGAAASLGSTAIVLRILRDKNDLDSLHGRFAIAVLLTQDIAVVPLLLVVSFVATQSDNLAASLGFAVIRTIVLVLAMTLVVSLVVPRLLDARAIAKNREIPILIAISSAVGAIWAAQEMGVSPALGAFIAGILLAGAKFADQMRADVFPLRTLFLTVFFVSVGLFADVAWMADNAFLLVATTAGLLLIKIVVTYLSTRPFQLSIVECLATSIAIAQVGEFSFLVLAVGKDGGLITEELFRFAASVTLLTLFLTPLLTGNARRISLKIAKTFVPKRRLAQVERAANPETRHGHIVVIGYGAAGGSAASTMQDSGWDVTVLDIDIAYVRLAEEKGMDAILGDGTQIGILEHANIEAAKSIIVAVPDMKVSRAIVSQCKHLAPDVLVFARARYHISAEELRVVGADVVVDEEQWVGELLGQRVLDQLTVRDSLDAVTIEQS